jgi:hypothetical protein
VFFDELFVPEANVLGEPNHGFAYARSDCGRLRHSVGGVRPTPADLGLLHQMIADSEIDIAATEALMVQAFWSAGSRTA